MTKLIEGFGQWLRDADKSTQTLRAYTSALARFNIWFEQTNRTSLTAKSLTPTDLRLYRDHLVQAKLKPSSINANLAALRALGQFIAEQTNGADPAAKFFANASVGYLPI